MQYRNMLSLKAKSCAIAGLIMACLLLPVLAYCDNYQVCDVNSTGNLTLSIVNDTSGTLIQGCNCTTLIYTTGYSLLMSTNMTDTATGYYTTSLDTVSTNETGVHPVTYSCECPEKNCTITSSYEVIPARILDYITNSTSPLYTNMWGFDSRTLSLDGIISIAQGVWDSMITGLREVDVIPILQTIQGRYGPETTTIPSDEISSGEGERYGEGSRYG
jgi:hypothetical protein